MTQKYRKGDLVSIQATVESFYGEDANPALKNTAIIKIDGQSTIYVRPDQITMIQPFFAAGERVVTKSSMHTRNKIFGTVIAMHEGDVWVKFDHGKTGTVAAVDLEPRPDAPQLSVVA